MKQWAVKSAIGEQETETLLNQHEQDGWSLFYFTVSNESRRFTCFFFKELDTPCKTQDTSLPTEQSKS